MFFWNSVVFSMVHAFIKESLKLTSKRRGGKVSSVISSQNQKERLSVACLPVFLYTEKSGILHFLSLLNDVIGVSPVPLEILCMWRCYCALVLYSESPGVKHFGCFQFFLSIKSTEMSFCT